jgi:hypothetical protein
MKQITTLLFALLLSGLGSGQVCYEAELSEGFIHSQSAGQYFVACADGDVITITLLLAEYQTTEMVLFANVYDDFNSQIGQTQIQDLAAFTFDGNMQLYNVTASILLSVPLIEGNQYRFEIDAQGVSTYANSTITNGFVAGVSVDNTPDLPMYSVNPVFDEFGNVVDKVIAIEYSKDFSSTISINNSICVGDCDGDGYIGISDVLCLIDEYGKSCLDQPLVMDLNGDCTVDDLDLYLFKMNYGHFCVPQ